MKNETKNETGNSNVQKELIKNHSIWKWEFKNIDRYKFFLQCDDAKTLSKQILKSHDEEIVAVVSNIRMKISDYLIGLEINPVLIEEAYESKEYLLFDLSIVDKNRDKINVLNTWELLNILENVQEKIKGMFSVNKKKETVENKEIKIKNNKLNNVSDMKDLIRVCIKNITGTSYLDNATYNFSRNKLTNGVYSYIISMPEWLEKNIISNKKNNVEANKYLDFMKKNNSDDLKQKIHKELDRLLLKSKFKEYSVKEVIIGSGGQNRYSISIRINQDNSKVF